jgi:hypothetical protein
MGQDADEEVEYYRYVILVYHFNGFWEKLAFINNWISSTWIPIMKKKSLINPYAKCFFIVEFDIQEDHDVIFKSGMWFWGKSGLCMKPWSPSFNQDSNILSLAPV